MREVFEDVARFSAVFARMRLRSYQVGAARAIAASVMERKGLSFVVIFPRQSGKNELQAHLEAYLLALFHETRGEIVKVSPTWKPQSLNAMRRLERVLDANELLKGRWRREQGYIYRVEKARITFLSGAATSNVVGATASLLLECDEAQEVSPAKWDKEINPMAASTNATRVFWGTAWSGETLLGRELRLARQLEEGDGQRRVFTLTADEVRQEAPAYGVFVDNEIRRLGRDHPMVRTQYFCEELSSVGGMFPEGRRAMVRGDHRRLEAPVAGQLYALLIDVAGEAEGAGRRMEGESQGGQAGGSDSRRDATALTIMAIDLDGLDDPLSSGAVYRVVGRRTWTGAAHTRLLAEIRALVELWGPRRIVIDATGIGAGLASFLGHTYGGLVRPFIFTAKSKAELGWKFLALIETGRFKDYAPMDELGVVFETQLRNCEMEAVGGPGMLIRWGVPDGRRDAGSGELVHDDLIISAAFCAVLDEEKWGRAESAVIPPEDGGWLSADGGQRMAVNGWLSTDGCQRIRGAD